MINTTSATAAHKQTYVFNSPQTVITHNTSGKVFIFFEGFGVKPSDVQVSELLAELTSAGYNVSRVNSTGPITLEVAAGDSINVLTQSHPGLPDKQTFLHFAN